jgi:hypothetical protein
MKSQSNDTLFYGKASLIEGIRGACEAGVLPVCLGEDLRGETRCRMCGVLGHARWQATEPCGLLSHGDGSSREKAGLARSGAAISGRSGPCGGAVADPRQYHTIITFDLFLESE